MNKFAIATLAIVVLSACTTEQQPVTPALDVPPAAEPAPAPAVPVTRPLPVALAEGVVFRFPYHFRTRRVDETPSGAFLEEFTVEYLESDLSKAATNLISDMIPAGFEILEDSMANGRRLIVFGKKDFGRVRARFAPADGRELDNPEAGGTLTMVWPSAGPATTTASSDR